MSTHMKFGLLVGSIFTISVTFYVFSIKKDSQIEYENNAPQNTKTDEVKKSDHAFDSEGADIIKDDPQSDQSRLADYPGFGHSIEHDEEIFTQEEITRENYIASCMKSNGFEYTPAPSVVVDASTASNPEEFERLLLAAAQDPNEKYVKTLSNNMRKAYYFALTGMENPNDQEAEAHNSELHRDSCVGQAFQNTPGIYAKRNALNAAYEEMELQISQDPRIVESLAAWSECMSDEGLSYQSPQDVHHHADQTVAQIIESDDQSSSAEFAKKEIENALNLLKDCEKKTALGATQRAVKIEYENRFVKQHMAQLSD